MKPHIMKHIELNKKVNVLIIIYLTIIALLLVFAVAGCKKPNDHISLNVNESSLAKAPVMLHFVNANPTSTVQPANFNVSISGKDSALVQMDGGATSNFQASHGFLPLSLISSAEPSTLNPVTFNVSAQIPGFAPVVQTITITQDTATIVDVGAVEYTNPAPGTSVLVNTSALNNGISGGITLNLPTGKGMVESAKITIPAGTQVMDVNSNPIAASSLSSNIVDYSANSSTSYGSFPGGFHPTNVIDASGNQVNGGYPINFVSAGLLSINMAADGTPVRHFSQPLQVSMKLDPNTTNFTTGNPIKAGDVVPLWSLTEATGQWKSGGNVTIASDGNGNLVADFTTTHLCAFNLDWSWAVSGHPYGTCFNPLKVTIHCGAGNSGIFDVTIVTPDYQYLAGAHGEYVHDGDVVVFPYVPDIAQCRVTINAFNLYLDPQLPILAQTGLFNPCGQGAIDITWGGTPGPQFLNVNLNITGHCSNKNVNLLPSGWFFIYDITASQHNKNPWTYVYVRNGIIEYAFGSPVTGSNGVYSIKMVEDDQYYIYAFNSSEWYESPVFTLQSQAFNFPAVAGLSGSATFNQATNTLNLKCVYSVHCH